mgnify:FL=1|tara:strand:+ start:8031 stop:9350 length:1320 start_codon:yes stop_codon:yes gene_type:complete
MIKSSVNIETSDCLPFDSKWNEQLWHFANNEHSVSVFNLAANIKQSEPLITFNYKDKKWYAGRYIGGINFTYKKEDVSITINPRFGDMVLYEMFEELFNIKFSKGMSSFKSQKKSYYLKILISYIWLQEMAKANRHGLPRKKGLKKHEGYSIKGRLLIMPSIKSIHKTGKLISARKEQYYDQTVLKILYEAYCILRKDYCLGNLNISDNAQDAIHQMETQFIDSSFIKPHDFNAIKYHPIYQRYKEVVNLSWQIIQSQPGYNSQDSQATVSGFFLDMAEIWECYVRSILKKHISSGWKIIDSQYEVYKEMFFRRRIIPDIVMKKGDNYCVFDAKYKHMKYRTSIGSYAGDVDRNDFFQIHTYMSYLKSKGNMIMGGLIYPVTKEHDGNANKLPCALYGTDNDTCFFADGPNIGDNSINYENFFTRILNSMPQGLSVSEV